MSPMSIRSEEELARLTAVLLEMDGREDLSPEEEVQAEVLTRLIQDYEEKHYALPNIDR
jgi:antitoxin component HigA of HigAB toxin-antitoxin module